MPPVEPVLEGVLGHAWMKHQQVRPDELFRIPEGVASVAISHQSTRTDRHASVLADGGSDAPQRGVDQLRQLDIAFDLNARLAELLHRGDVQMLEIVLGHRPHQVVLRPDHLPHAGSGQGVQGRPDCRREDQARRGVRGDRHRRRRPRAAHRDSHRRLPRDLRLPRLALDARRMLVLRYDAEVNVLRLHREVVVELQFDWIPTASVVHHDLNDGQVLPRPVEVCALHRDGLRPPEHLFHHAALHVQRRAHHRPPRPHSEGRRHAGPARVLAAAAEQTGNEEPLAAKLRPHVAIAQAGHQ
mmetsp:Transcript_49477/g.159760  ORF Transcript_49477/g.159760 Transcript_49477/m.159760 type:complete len:299 (-) Transcript_49477:479-1375(-)